MDSSDKQSIKLKHLLFIIATVLLSTALLYLPFFFNILAYFGFTDVSTSLQTIYQNYDGALYIVPAKTWYIPSAIQALRLEQNLPAIYFAAHLPLYPFFIWLFSVIGYLQSMIFVVLVFSVMMSIAFYLFLVKFQITKYPLILTIVFLFLPRLLIVRSVGAPETLFIFLILASVYFFEKSSYFIASIFGALAAMTKTPGVLLFVAYAFVFSENLMRHKKIEWRSLWILLIPLGLLGVFVFYGRQYGDFFAYFHTGGVVPMPYPFSAFNFQARWVGTAWLEDIVLYLFFYGFALTILWKRTERSIFYFFLVFFVSTVFVQHRDLSRYFLPLWPFTCMAYEKVFTSKRFILVLLILLPAIYLYAINFMLYNALPISDWRAFL